MIYSEKHGPTFVDRLDGLDINLGMMDTELVVSSKCDYLVGQVNAAT
jgi:hypothetical protein